MCKVKTKDKHDLYYFENGRSIRIERAVVIIDVRVRRIIRVRNYSNYSRNTAEEQHAVMKIKLQRLNFQNRSISRPKTYVFTCTHVLVDN